MNDLDQDSAPTEQILGVVVNKVDGEEEEEEVARWRRIVKRGVMEMCMCLQSGHTGSFRWPGMRCDGVWVMTLESLVKNHDVYVCMCMYVYIYIFLASDSSSGQTEVNCLGHTHECWQQYCGPLQSSWGLGKPGHGTSVSLGVGGDHFPIEQCSYLHPSFRMRSVCASWCRVTELHTF